MPPAPERVEQAAVGAPLVLVVDDLPQTRTLFARTLTRSGMHVVVAANGEAALAAVRIDPPDVVVSDLSMPGMDGLGLCRALRTDPATMAVRFLIVSGGPDLNAAAARAAGCDAVLTKPCSPALLLSVVRGLLARTSATPAPPPRQPGVTG